jgi:3-methyladenine DNA glycosylase AlkD
LSDKVDQLFSELRERICAPVLNTSRLRTVRREFSSRLAKSGGPFIFKLAKRLLQEKTIKCRFMAYELIAHHALARSQLNRDRLEQLGKGIDSWSAVDMFAVYLAGPAWQAKQVSGAAIRRWAQSHDRWWRRAALVATVPLNSKTHGGAGDAQQTLTICRLLVSDRDDMVVKAMSWALRALAKRDPKSVKAFLLAHRERLAPRILREVRNKLDTGLKNPRRARQN